MMVARLGADYHEARTIHFEQGKVDTIGNNSQWHNGMVRNGGKFVRSLYGLPRCGFVFVVGFI